MYTILVDSNENKKADKDRTHYGYANFKVAGWNNDPESLVGSNYQTKIQKRMPQMPALDSIDG